MYGVPMPPALFVIETGSAGRLATMAHPATDDRLPDAMVALRQSGVDILVSALTPDEYRLLGLVHEPHEAVAAGLDFRSLPIRDVDIPAGMAPVLDLSARLAEDVGAGRFVVTHCRAGIGRCSMLAGATLVRMGVSPDEAWQRIRTARGLPVPDNGAQERWLYEFADEVARLST
jgi:protein-tyrosine phosphatase